MLYSSDGQILKFQDSIIKDSIWNIFLF